MNWQGRGVSQRTTDGGRTWTGMTATDFDVVMALAGWAVSDTDWRLYTWDGNLGESTLEETRDAGLTWTRVPGFQVPRP